MGLENMTLRGFFCGLSAVYGRCIKWQIRSRNKLLRMHGRHRPISDFSATPVQIARKSIEY
jgi:hypothetical protein